MNRSLKRPCLAGCASVRIQKLGTDGVLINCADGGVRIVFEPFIVWRKVYLAAGELSPDGNYILLTDVLAVSELAKLINPKLIEGKRTMGSSVVELSKVLAQTALNGSPNGADTTNYDLHSCLVNGTRYRSSRA